MATMSREDAVSVAVLTLLRGPIYAEEDGDAWDALRMYTGRVQEHLAVMGLRAVIDDSDEFAYLRSFDELPAGAPRLSRRHRLTRTATMLLVLLRERLGAAEAHEGNARVQLDAMEMVEMLRPYFPAGSNEAKGLADVERLKELGYLKQVETDVYEVRRIVKAQVSAEWLNEYSKALFAAADDTEADGDSE